MFQPLLEPNISDVLNINKLYKKLSKSKTPHIFITIANPSNKDIFINKGDILVQLFIKEINVNNINQEAELNPSEKWQPIVYLRDLTKEQSLWCVEKSV